MSARPAYYRKAIIGNVVYLSEIFGYNKFFFRNDSFYCGNYELVVKFYMQFFQHLFEIRRRRYEYYGVALLYYFVYVVAERYLTGIKLDAGKIRGIIPQTYECVDISLPADIPVQMARLFENYLGYRRSPAAAAYYGYFSTI